mmetsp:Transcript_9750/g.14706  ORF Transcript_9750/g.14706 Transcript_9750/m.14706 type:complete len:457 (+) Transcript_9750:45-1415(+)
MSAQSTQLSQEKIDKAVESLREKLIEVLQRLVSFQSFRNHPDEINVMTYVESLLAEHGFSSERVYFSREKFSSYPGYCPVSWPDTSIPSLSSNSTQDPQIRFNLIASRPGAQQGKGRTLIFNSHFDVVPVEDDFIKSWDKSGPFEGKVIGDALYGRGAGDMKGGFVAAFIALCALEKLGFQSASRITFHAVSEEECSGNGTHAIVSSGAKHTQADAVIIPEPLPGIMSAQLGVLWAHVQVKGRSVHVLDTSAGHNAIESCYLLWEALKSLEEKLNADPTTFPHAYQSFKHPINLNLGQIRGGVWPSSVPSTAHFSFRLGYFPTSGDDALAQCKKQLEQALANAGSQHHIDYELRYDGFQADGYIYKDMESSLFGQTLANAHLAVTQEKPIFTPATCTTDARYYYLLQNKTPVTCYGPKATSIHGINEHVSLQSIQQTAKTFIRFIESWCQLVKIEE